MGDNIIFRQLFDHDSHTYTYLIADPVSRQAALIDPVLETIERDLRLIEELDLKLTYVLDTHVHADHVTAAGEIRARTGAKTGVSEKAAVTCADLMLNDGEELPLGRKKILVRSTPGHTDSCLTFLFEGMAFTGDALLIRGCGRTDFQQGSSDRLFESVRTQLFTLPDETLVYPAHDYRGQTSSTIGEEKKFNPRLKESITKEEFKLIMSEVKLAAPKRIHEALPANMSCGQLSATTSLKSEVINGIPEVSVETLVETIQTSPSHRIRLIDVRRSDEFNNDLGHVPGSQLITLGPDLLRFLEEGDRTQQTVFICRSGARSGQATLAGRQMGYEHCYNMTGGMIRWNEAGLPTERESGL